MELRSAIAGALCLAAGLGATGCGGTEPVPPERPANPGGAEVPTGVYGTNHELLPVEIEIASDGLSQPKMNARAGSIITWANRTDSPVTIKSIRDSALRFSSGSIEPGEEYRITLGDRGLTKYRTSGGGGSHKGTVKAY